jgi:quinone-modifying oxidoreductase subunit QmoA
MQPKTMNLKVGAVVIATGWQPYDPAQIDNLGFGKYPNVVSNVMIERLAAPNGPTKGRVLRPSDGKQVQSAVFIQCAGSRDHNHLGYCSGICCLASMKEATYLRERNPDARIHIFYIDLRTPGPYEFFSERVQTQYNVSIVKGKVARVWEDGPGGDLIVDAEDILSARKMQLRTDLVVLATGMVPSLVAGEIDAPISFDADNFVVPDETAPGIYAAGCARAPVDVATSVQDATAAALKAIGAIQMGVRGQGPATGQPEST